jgi:uncharacterized membrane protein YccF (DUF307 family)
MLTGSRAARHVRERWEVGSPRTPTLGVAVRLLLNIIWFVLAGLWLAIGYAIAALIMFILIITIPFGIASLRIALYALWPFGRTIVRHPKHGVMSTIGNVIWFVLAGWWLAIIHLILALGLALTIIGIPFAWAHLKLAGASLAPVGTEIVPRSSPRPVLY